MPPPFAPHPGPPAEPADELEETLVLAQIEGVMAEFRQRAAGAPLPPPERLTPLLLARPTPDALAQPGPEHRLTRRKKVTRRTPISFRKGTMGLGRDLGIELIDAAEDGLGVRIKEAVPPGEEASLEVSVPGVSKPVKLVAAVRWCRPAGDGTFLAGLLLRRRLTYSELAGLAR